MVTQRGRLRALHVLKPPEVLARELTEGHASPTALFGVALDQRLLLVVLTRERKHPSRGFGLGQHALGRSSTLPPPTTAAVRSTQARPRARTWPAVPRPLPVPEGTGRALPDERRLEDVIEKHRTAHFGRNVSPGNGAKSCPRGQRSGATFLPRNPYFNGISTNQIARKYRSQTPRSGFLKPKVAGSRPVVRSLKAPLRRVGREALDQPRAAPRPAAFPFTIVLQPSRGSGRSCCQSPIGG